MMISEIRALAKATLGHNAYLNLNEMTSEALGYARGRLDAANGGHPAPSEDAYHFAGIYAQAAYDCHTGQTSSLPAIYALWDEWDAAGRPTV